MHRLVCNSLIQQPINTKLGIHVLFNEYTNIYYNGKHCSKQSSYCKTTTNSGKYT